MASPSSSTPILSRRGQTIVSFPSFLSKYGDQVIENCYNKDTNPEGIVNLGVAEFPAVEDLLLERLSRPDMQKTDVDMLFYSCNIGTLGFRTSIAQFLTERWNTNEPVDPQDVIIQNGLCSGLDSVAAAIGDPGDVLLCPSPCYYSIPVDVGLRPGLKCVYIPLTSKLEEGDERPFQLTVKKIEKTYLEAKAQGLTIRGIVLINPHNPLGDVYPLTLLNDILQFCNKHALHVIMDEIYAFSVFEETATFKSVLSLPSIDPQRTHVLWGFSKDFGLSGLRCGVLITKSEPVKSYCVSTGLYQFVPVKIQQMLQTIITDKDWLDNVYFPEQKKRMKFLFRACCKELSELGLTVHPGVSTFFIWADFTPYLKSKTTEAELELFEKLFFEGGVCLVPGSANFCSEPGWFRLVFTQKEEVTKEGIKRIKAVLKQIKDQK